MKKIIFFCLVLITASCGPSIHIDYDKEADFSRKTYQFYDAHTRKASQVDTNFELGLNELDKKRVERAIDSSLGKKSWTKTDYCQFYVRFYAQEYESGSRNTLGVGIGGGGRNVGVGVSGGIPIGRRTIEQRLIVEIIGAYDNGPLVWEVIIDGELKENATPEQKEQYYLSAIEKAFKKFPPK